MRTTIDGAGRLVVPKALREQLGFIAGMELDVDVVDDHLEVVAPSRATVEQGPHGLRLAAPDAQELTTEQVRELIERGRR
jgi:AbrB family looped-hinge helix DNA binding protein